MSFFTGTQAELLYSFYGAATVSVPTTTPGSSMILGYPSIVVPGGYMRGGGKTTPSLKLQLGGFLTATATVPTFSFALYSTSATPAVWAATNLLATASTAVTPTAGTSYQYEMEFHVGLRTLALGAGSTVVTQGRMRCTQGFPTPFEVTIPPTGTGNTFATWDVDQQYFLWPTIILSAATASNTVTTQWAKLYGEN